MATAARAGRAAKRAANSRWVEWPARVGFCSRGVVYGVIGLIALQIASRGSTSGQHASKDGALREIAERSYGRALLVVLAVGLGGYAIWRLSEAVWGTRTRTTSTSAPPSACSRGQGAVYLAFLCSTLRFVANGPAGGGGRGDQQEETMTARILDLPAGQLVVGAVGVGLIVGGRYVVYRGIARSSRSGSTPARWVRSPAGSST